MDNQIQLGRKLGGQQRWEHRIGLISLRGELQRRVFLGSLRQHFNLRKSQLDSGYLEAAGSAYYDALDFCLIALLDVEINFNPMFSPENSERVHNLSVN